MIVALEVCIFLGLAGKPCATNGITLAPSQGTGTDIAQLPVNGIVCMKLRCEDSGYGGVRQQCDALRYGCGASAGWHRVQWSDSCPHDVDLTDSENASM